MSPELITLDTSDAGLAVVSINRPEKRNALNIALMEQLSATLENLAGQTNLRVIILRGEGKVFCSGLDLKEGTEPDLANRSAGLVARTLGAVEESPKVTIAAAHGAAVAGGAGLLLACDLAVGTDNLRVGFTEVRRGLIGGLIMPYLVRKLGYGRTLELLLTAQILEGPAVLETGFVNRLVPERNLMNEARSLARTVMLGGPSALSQTKRFLRETWLLDSLQVSRRALELHREVRLSSEAQEGMLAFLENRPPNWWIS